MKRPLESVWYLSIFQELSPMALSSKAKVKAQAHDSSVEGSASAARNSVEGVLEALSKMTQLELFELEALIKERFNLGDLALGASSGDSGSQNVSSKAASVSLYLDSLGELSKVEGLKALNAALGLTIAQAKEILEKLPYKILESVTREEAEAKLRTIEDARKGLELSIK